MRQAIRPLIFAITFVATAATTAFAVELRHDHPDKYHVQKGDTLWGISEKFLKDPWVWPTVWQANPQLKNPHLIYPGDLISLVYIDGKPQLVINRGRPLVKLTPQGRIETLDRPVSTVSADAIRPFLSKPRIVGKNELEKAPYIVHPVGERMMVGTGDKVYVRGTQDQNQKNYAVVRAGATYVDPFTKEVLGYEAKYVGDSHVVQQGDPATYYLRNTVREVFIGDRMLPEQDQAYHDHFIPKAGRKELRGAIIAVMEGLQQIGQHQIVIINRGTREGVEVGHVYAVYQHAKLIKDSVVKSKQVVRLPEERAGIIMVFRAYEKLSYALVMRAERNMKVLDIVATP